MADQPNIWAIIADNRVVVRGTQAQMTSIYNEFLHDMECAKDTDWVPNKVELVEVFESQTPKKEVNHE